MPTGSWKVTMGNYSCGLKYKARKPVFEVEDWLDKNCSGDWDVRLEGIDDSDPKGVVNHLAVLFEKAEDRDKFKAAMSGR